MTRTREECRIHGHLWIKRNRNQEVCACGVKRWVDQHGHPLRYEKWDGK